MKEVKIKPVDYFFVFLRSFFMQAAWNFKSMISIGWCFALIPVGKRLFQDREQYKKFLKRHLLFFNAHPYFASYALGSVAYLEEKEVQSLESNLEQIEKFKNAVIGPLGALGDQLFWATIKPASILLGFAGVLMLDTVIHKMLSIILALLIYNIPHFYVRFFGLKRGYKEGLGIYKTLHSDNFALLIKIYSGSGAMVLGASIGFLTVRIADQNLIGLTIFLMSIIIAYFLRSKKRMTYIPVFLPLLIAFMIGIIVG